VTSAGARDPDEIDDLARRAQAGDADALEEQDPSTRSLVAYYREHRS